MLLKVGKVVLFLNCSIDDMMKNISYYNKQPSTIGQWQRTYFDNMDISMEITLVMYYTISSVMVAELLQSEVL